MASVIILGLNAHHADAAACLLRDGVVVAACAEERLSRVKHQAGFPRHAIAHCLSIAGLSTADIDAVAVNRDNRAARWHKLAFLLRRPPSPALVLQKLRNRKDWSSLPEQLANLCGITAPVHPIEHHLAHLACARAARSAGSPETEAPVLAVSVDGFGDFAGAAWGRIRPDDPEPTPLGRIRFPHSLGLFYQAMTQFLGFPNYGDEYKVMGLAAHGRPTRTERVATLIKTDGMGRFKLNLSYFRHHREAVAYEWSAGVPVVGTLYTPALTDLLGPARDPEATIAAADADLAASVQAVFETALFAFLNGIHSRTPAEHLVLAGGCAQNSLANGKITAKTPFRSVHIPAAPADDGGAVGAAMVLHGRLTGTPPPAPAHSLQVARSGGFAAADDITRAIAERDVALSEAGITCSAPLSDEALADTVAAHLAQGAVIGWFQGQMEWGPRALGGRSILADPRRGDMRDLLNRKIKRRESFRPFAPSVLAEQATDWFHTDWTTAGDANDTAPLHTPVMAKVVPVRADKAKQIPAICHQDGTARVQTVSQRADPLYHALISAFAARTGVPMLLNTSFNENEPIVCRPEEAIDCFLRTRMDALAIGSNWLTRPFTPPPASALPGVTVRPR